MLELIREKMKGAFATVIVVFFCAVFALWGVESLFNRAGKAPAVATVNGEDITEPEVAQAIKRMRQNYMEMFGGKVDPGFLNDQMLREPALDSVISLKLLNEQIDTLKMTAGTVTLDRDIVRNPIFSRDGKAFDPEYYREQLRAAGITPTGYRDQLKEQLAMTQLQQGIAGTAFVTQKQVDSAAALAAQKRSFEYITLPLKAAMDAVTPTDQDIAKYFSDHAAEFMTEEKVSIEYLDLNKAALTKDIQVEEAEVRAGYDAEAANFKPATERRAAHILIEEKPDGSEKAQLEEIAKKINAGEKFEALAKQFSSDTESAKQGGDVGFSNGTAFVPEFEQALAALVNIGDVSPPVKTEFGYHIIKLLEKRDTAFPSYEERKAAIEKQLRDTKAATVYAEKLDQMTESTYSAGDLAGPAAELKMDLQKTAAFGRRGGAGIASQQKVIDAAFSSDLLDSGKNSQVIELSADRAVVLRVSNHEISKPRELSDASAEIVNAIKKEQAVAALKEKAEAIKGRVQTGANLAVVGADEKATLVTVNDKVRLDKGSDAELVATAFKLDKPVDGRVSVDTVQLATGDWVILHLLAVNDTQPDKNGEAYKTLQKQLDTTVGNTDFATYEQSLRQKAKIVRAVADSEANEKTD